MASFLKNIFTPKWQHSDATIRLQALDQKLDNTIIEKLATEDSDQSVRLKAISLITDSASLLKLSGEKSNNVKQAAKEQYLLVTLNSHNEQDQLKQLESINDPQTLINIASLTDSQSLALNAINQIKSESALFDFIKSSPSAKSRLIAAEHISNQETLKSIEQLFLNKDKNLVRLVKNKLSAITDAQTIEQARQDTINKLIDDAKTLSTQAFSPTYAGQVAFLKQSWKKVSVSDSQESEFNRQIQLCESNLKEHQAIQAQIDEQQAAQKQAQSMQLQILDQLKSFTAESKSSTPSINAVNGIIEQCQNDWKSSIQLHQSIESQIKSEFESLLKPLVNLQSSLAYLENTTLELQPIQDALANKALNVLQSHKVSIAKFVKSINWPSEFPNNKFVNRILAIQGEIDQGINNLKLDEKQLLNALSQSLEKFEDSIKQGNLKASQQIQATIRKQLDQLDSSKAKTQRTQFQALSQSLGELKDWQGFATLPKFEDLCEKMTALIEADMPPQEKANSIKALQDEWKSLGSLPNQKQQQALWQNFKAASDKAFEPCQAYFGDMAKVRQYNLEQRTIICEQLEQFYELNDWSTPDWKSIQQILDKAHTEFKQFSPVDNAQKKAIMQRFHDITFKVNGKLVEHFKENAAEKQALIDQVAALNEHEDIQHAIETCKEIQNKWKTKGNAGRAERQLWGAFRAQCDAIFEKRNAANQARKAHIDEHISQANTLVDNLLELSQQSSEQAKLEANTVLQSLKDLELPQKVRVAIEKRFDDIKQSIEQDIKNSKAKAQHALWQNAQTLAQQLSEVESNGDNPADLKGNIEGADIPQKVKSIFEKRINNAKVSEDNLHKLCLELEILLDIPSPESEQAERMNLQVERLQKNMGQKLPTLEEQLRELQCRWFAVQVDSPDYLALQQRFFGALNKRYEAQA